MDGEFLPDFFQKWSIYYSRMCGSLIKVMMLLSGTPHLLLRPCDTENRSILVSPLESFLLRTFFCHQLAQFNNETTPFTWLWHTTLNRSHPITEVWAWSVSTWVTNWKHQVLLSVFQIITLVSYWGVIAFPTTEFQITRGKSKLWFAFV